MKETIFQNMSEDQGSLVKKGEDGTHDVATQTEARTTLKNMKKKEKKTTEQVIYSGTFRRLKRAYFSFLVKLLNAINQSAS